MTAEKKGYLTAAAFRAALEARLARLAREEGTDLQRLRRQVAFDRWLARVFDRAAEAWILKGGYAMELRLRSARATRDIDLAMGRPAEFVANPADLPSRLRIELQRMADLDLGDRFEFLVAEAVMEIEAAPSGGARFPVESRLAGRTFVRFHVDVGVGDRVLEPVEHLAGRDWLGFDGIAPLSARLLSKEQQFAEKLHAYTRPERERPNSRVKDLVDLALLVRRFELNREAVRKALQETFGVRATHGLPAVLQQPPEFWRKPFLALAEETQLGLDMDEALRWIQDFLSDLR